MTEEADRITYIAKIRERMKQKGITIKWIASCTGKSPQWITDIFQGNYPHHKAYRLPQFLIDYLTYHALLPSSDREAVPPTTNDQGAS
jgi:transcriptional regulator with XRE-family HTH domain